MLKKTIKELLGINITTNDLLMLKLYPDKCIENFTEMSEIEKEENLKKLKQLFELANNIKGLE